MNITTVPDGSDVVVTVTADVKHRCPFRDEADVGTTDITWRVNGQTVELHSLRGWLDQFIDSGISHESVTNCIAYAVASLDGIEDVTVATHWTTAGMAVTVTGGGVAISDRPREP